MKSLVKSKPTQVLLNAEDDQALTRFTDLERKRRGDVTVGKGTILRELAMPRVRDLLAAAECAAA